MVGGREYVHYYYSMMPELGLSTVPISTDLVTNRDHSKYYISLMLLLFKSQLYELLARKKYIYIDQYHLFEKVL